MTQFEQAIRERFGQRLSVILPVAQFLGKAGSRLSCRLFLFLLPAKAMNSSADAHEAGATASPINRRSFLGVLLGFGTAVVGAALSIPLLRVALHPLLSTTTRTDW